MIFVGYEPGSKGYQFWDAAHHRIEISRDVKFNETQFPAKEATKSQASTNDLPISESDNKSDKLGLELVIPAHSSPRPPSPGQSASGSQNPSVKTHPNPPIAPPAVQSGLQPSGSGPPPAGPIDPTPYTQQRSIWLANNLLEKTLTPYWQICSKKFPIHTEKQ